MAKKRFINTKFWDDPYIVDLDPLEKLLFLYFLTNPLTDICGIYEIQLRRVAFDTGIDKEMILKIIDRFSQNKKVYYLDGWIYVKNFSKHQSVNDSIQKGIVRSLETVPKEILSKIKQIETDCPRVGGASALPTLTPTPIPILKPTPKRQNGDFETFWKTYPRKVSKKTAEKAWNKIDMDENVFQAVMTALNKYKACEQWTKDGGKFIPHPATWLNQERWNDEIISSLPPEFEKFREENKSNIRPLHDGKSAIWFSAAWRHYETGEKVNVTNYPELPK